MSTPFASRDPESRRELVPRDETGVSDDVESYARVEGLVHEETALLAIPAEQRHAEHHDRLRAVTEELDQVWEHLRARAERLGRAHDSSRQS